MAAVGPAKGEALQQVVRVRSERGRRRRGATLSLSNALVCTLSVGPRPFALAAIACGLWVGRVPPCEATLGNACIQWPRHRFSRPVGAVQLRGRAISSQRCLRERPKSLQTSHATMAVWKFPWRPLTVLSESRECAEGLAIDPWCVWAAASGLVSRPCDRAGGSA